VATNESNMVDVLIILIGLIITGTLLFYTAKYSFKYGLKLGDFLKNKVLSDQDRLTRLIELLFSEGKEAVLNDINNLKKSPLAFIQNHQQLFDNRGMDEEYAENFEMLFKVVLEHHLDLHNNFLVIDHKHSGYDGLASINGLLNINEIPSIFATKEENAERGIHHKYLDYDSEDYLTTFDFLIYISNILYRFGFTIIELNFGGDSFDMFVLSKSKLPEVMEHFQKLKIDVIPMHGLSVKK